MARDSEHPPLPGAAEIARWPAGERRDPAWSDPHYLALRPLAEQLKEALARLCGGRTDLRVLDIGCGAKPYLPLAAPYASTYVGIDAVDGPWVDRVGTAEDIPCEDGSVDLVLCTQVLEHVQDPRRSLAEIRRVLAPGGVVLLSTHGVFLYHPDPPESDRDYWRWTHSGLRKEFQNAGEWSEIEITASGNIISALAYSLAQFVDEAGSRILPDWLRRGVMSVFNRVTVAIDARFPPRARFPAGGSMTANYLVAAVKDGAAQPAEGETA